MADENNNPPGTPPAAAAPPAEPPAGKTVKEGTETEEVNSLRKKLAESEGGRKKVEQRNVELEDENRRLKQPPQTQPQPGPKKGKRGWGFFGEEA
jgi:hypothetical protein